jgi:hypothetical protein
MGIIFLISALSFNFNPLENPLRLSSSYWITQPDYTNLTQSPKLSVIPGAFIYTSTSKGFNSTPSELGTKIYILEGLGATAGGVLIGGATIVGGTYLLLLMVFGSFNIDKPGSAIFPCTVLVVSLSGVPLGAVYGTSIVAKHYQLQGSGWGAFFGSLIGAGVACAGLIPRSTPVACASLLAFPTCTVIGYNYKHIFHK